MNKIFTIVVLFGLLTSAFPNKLRSANDNMNVLSYYAITNELDGQPMFDMNNVLRFYPVFSFRENTTTVDITIYKNGARFNIPAIANEDKSYWEIKLPSFEMGEAIQRIEVEAKIEAREFYAAALNEYKLSVLREMKNSCCEKNDTCNDKRCTEFMSMLKRIDDFIKADYAMSRIEISMGKNLNLDKAQDAANSLYYTAELEKIDVSEVLELYKSKIDEQYSRLLAHNWLAIDRYTEIPEAVTSYLVRKLSDTMQVGTSIRAADIKFDKYGKEANLLYRNYKRGVRYLTALDPAERLGLFRLRYIPFAIIGKELVKPVGDNATGIFEIGMSFGDPIVSGDDFAVPALSFERLGIAFAISHELFSDSARVAALAFTYDFNSYGSIAAGTNFNTNDNKIQSYLSLGINRKAFEGIVKIIQGFFR